MSTAINKISTFSREAYDREYLEFKRLLIKDINEFYELRDNIDDKMLAKTYIISKILQKAMRKKFISK